MTELLKVGDTQNAETMTSLQIAENMNKEVFSNLKEIDGVSVISTFDISNITKVEINYIHTLVREYIEYATFYNIDYYVVEYVENDNNYYKISYLETIFITSLLSKINLFCLIQNAFQIEKDKKQWEDIYKTMLGNTKTHQSPKTYLLLDEKSKYCKIGKTVDVPSRIKQLSTGNPNLKLIGFCDNDMELELHSLYKDKRITNEWYNLTEIDISDIVALFNNTQPQQQK